MKTIKMLVPSLHMARTAATVIALLLFTGVSAQVSINKRWLIGNEQDGLTLYDMSRPDVMQKAQMPSAEDIKESHGVQKAGVFYLEKGEKYRVKADSPTSGEVQYLTKNGEYVTGFLYSNLTATSVDFLFEGEFEWKAHLAGDIEIVDPNTLELNIEDMSDVFNYRQDDATAMATLCEGKDMKRIALVKNEEYGTVELWGRGLKLNGINLERSGDEEAMGIMFCNKPGEHIFVTIAFSDKRLIKEYETQLARRWCFPRQTREVEEGKVVTYADKYWEEESDDSVYTLTDNHKGLYTITYFVML